MIKPTKTLYNSQSDAIPSEVSIKLLNRAKSVAPEDCPWVQVGNLYLSVTVTGDASWLPLLARLHQSGYRKFSVFSGRHGDIPNKVDSKGATQGVFDQKHLKEDEDVKIRALKEFENITIEIVDTHAGEKNQKQWLIEKAKQRFQTDTPVIFAWCYSMFTMSEFHRKIVDLELTESEKAAYTEAQAEEISKPISEIVRTNFAWAMMGGERNSARPSGSLAATRRALSQSGDALYASTEAPTAFADKSAG